MINMIIKSIENFLDSYRKNEGGAMRILLLLRGAAGCGKSTFVKEHNLQPYTLCLDDFRLYCRNPILTVNGKFAIDQTVTRHAVAMLTDAMERKMKQGDFIVLDQTHTKTKDFTKSLMLAKKYGYKIHCVDFFDVAKEQCKKQNKQREPYKQVPETVIDQHYENSTKYKIPVDIQIIPSKKFTMEMIIPKKTDLSTYQKVHHFGDIHGCYQTLQKAIPSIESIHPDEYYIFTGDYVDRGVENAKTLQLLMQLSKLPNVMFLEGNHEFHLKRWSYNEKSESQTFETGTKRELEAQGVSKVEVRKFCDQLKECFLYTYHGQDVFVTHGGISQMKTNVLFLSSYQLIHGVGTYKDANEVDETFTKNHPDMIQVHGHRNTQHVPIQVTECTFNLEGAIERGGELREMTLIHEGDYVLKETHSYPSEPIKESTTLIPLEEELQKLEESPYIKKRKFGRYAAFNFTREAFRKDIWNEQTVNSRGLFVDTKLNEVAGRGFEKFFTVNEREETMLEQLKEKFQFPVNAYVKENGFLGLLFYDTEADDFVFATKNNIGSDYAKLFKTIFYEVVDVESILKIKEYLKTHAQTLVFEVIDPTYDPHIIEYPIKQLILLNLIDNTLKYHHCPNMDLNTFAKEMKLQVKEKAYILHTWEEFEKWYNNVQAEDYVYKGKPIEGFVVEDMAQFQVKVKTFYYKFWKQMRNVLGAVLSKGSYRKEDQLNSKALECYQWMKDHKEQLSANIIDVRAKYLSSKRD